MRDLVAAYDPREHSRVLLDGPDRAAARSMLKAIGFTDEDLSKPIIDVGATWETMPCNYNRRKLAFRVKEGIRAAGGTPMEFNTISASDGVSMGTEGGEGAGVASGFTPGDHYLGELLAYGADSHLLTTGAVARRRRRTGRAKG
jgi:dihydroxyacid dehydratase/phosphogluconate dehydratase